MQLLTGVTLYGGMAPAATSRLFALGVVLYPKLKTERPGYPFEAASVAALLPITLQGECASPTA